ncbi:hypothetical protein Aph02nite_48650 [Actinoplanes philippinensis]|nr:hypothetical protein Aph02nite_48650 [Actinoplanes philippinensis]
MSCSSRIVDPPVADPARNGIARIAKRHPHARCGSACNAYAATYAIGMTIAARRGPVESDMLSTVAEPSRVISGPPNIDSAVRTGEPVVA